MSSTPATGSGWFKIYESGFDGKWCTEKLIDQNGLLSVQLPGGLPGGYYLVRPEILALHEAHQGDPQYYVGCAQIFIEGEAATLSIPPDKEVSIPGYIDGSEPGNTINIYEPFTSYAIPGPGIYSPGSSSAANATPSTSVDQQDGMIPSNCLLKNGNWCGFEVPSYRDEQGCWAAGENCHEQTNVCYERASPAGYKNCDVWSEKCRAIQDACEAGNFLGPPGGGKILAGAVEFMPGSIPDVESMESGSTTLVEDMPMKLAEAAPAAVEDGETSAEQPTGEAKAEKSSPGSLSITPTPQLLYSNAEFAANSGTGSTNGAVGSSGPHYRCSGHKRALGRIKREV